MRANYPDDDFIEIVGIEDINEFIVNNGQEPIGLQNIPLCANGEPTTHIITVRYRGIVHAKAIIAESGTNAIMRASGLILVSGIPDLIILKMLIPQANWH
jgi:hypothetical protein